MTQLTERLREWASEPQCHEVPPSSLLLEAADELERQQRDAERYRWLRGRAYKDGATLAIDVAVIDDVAIGDFGEFIDATADAAMACAPAVG